MFSTSKSWLVLVMIVVYDVGHPWRISCTHHKAVTGVVPRQIPRDPNHPQDGIQAWNKRRRSHGPPSQNPCPTGVSSKDRTDITRGTFQALRLIKARGFYQTSTPYGVPFYSARSKRSFLAILLPTDSHLCTHFFAGPLRLLESFSRAFDVSLQHVRARTSSSSSRSSRLAVADYADHPVRSLSPVCMERPQEPLSSPPSLHQMPRAEFP